VDALRRRTLTFLSAPRRFKGTGEFGLVCLLPAELAGRRALTPAAPASKKAELLQPAASHVRPPPFARM
jgi:hypothetical protein